MTKDQQTPQDIAFAHIAGYINNLVDVAQRLKNDLQILKSFIEKGDKNND